MIVVADSSPLQYLILLEQTPLLERFYGHVFIPDVVAAELGAPRAPESVRAWILQPPSWIGVMTVDTPELEDISDSLDRGERAAIALAERLRADLILIDEADGRAEAMRRRLRVTGMLGVLRAAAEEGLIDVPEILAKLETTNFYVDPDLLVRIFGKWLR